MKSTRKVQERYKKGTRKVQERYMKGTKKVQVRYKKGTYKKGANIWQVTMDSTNLPVIMQ